MELVPLACEDAGTGATALQPRNYQISIEVVHNLDFEDVAVMQM